ncbi:hypothetical protein FVF58_09295 [Paraburkholderia panacisoli]|uniref:Uncharacterized protein n=1 Tax=Paraburkholderia panacisoli TaxID=2603818 RepID=A0A5B0HCF7_9BURK|nr:hypothetical protein [Paraburkholderia panacisoli]KAA1012979.1 hypothetical protein FVF58_09295 [Paraburkholderia panacisoli]
MSYLINKLRERAAYIRSISAPRYKDQAAQIYDEAADALESANARIASVESDLAFQKSVTDAARQHQTDLLERAEDAEARTALASSDAQAEGGKSEAVPFGWIARNDFDIGDGVALVGAKVRDDDVPLYTAQPAECASRDVLKALFEVLMRRNIEITSEVYLTLRCVGVPPSKKEFVGAIEQAAKEKA